MDLLNNGKSAEDIIMFLETFKEQDALDVINRLIPTIQFDFTPDRAELINSKLKLKREELKVILQEQEKKSSGYASDFK